MYAFAQRADTTVVDEPLYAHYLSTTDADEYHPGADEVIASQENDGALVVRDVILGSYDTPVLFIKNMTHHLANLDWGFMPQTVNVILTRDPYEMLPSYVKNVATPTMRDVGYAGHIELLKYLRGLGQEPPVLDGMQVLLNPHYVLGELCERIGIPFDETMLSWKAGAREEDGVWGKYWYEHVWRSEGFGEYRPKSNPFPEHLKPLLAECQPYYEQLAALAIKAR
jgi:hypothetical protein